MLQRPNIGLQPTALDAIVIAAAEAATLGRLGAGAMLIRTLLLVVLATGVVAAQPPTAEIAGRITDEQRWILPGARVTVTIDGQAQHAVTDDSGHFVLRRLAFGTHRVVVELPGFRTVTGQIVLSPSEPKAFLGWSMAIGCLMDQTVIFGPREAARLAASIVHIRVTEATGPVIVSEYPECEGKRRHGYAVQVVASVGRAAEVGVGRSQILTYENALTPGREYVALLWPNAVTTPDYILPVVAGRVVAPNENELNGRRLHEALRLLQKWSQVTRP